MESINNVSQEILNKTALIRKLTYIKWIGEAVFVIAIYPLMLLGMIIMEILPAIGIIMPALSLFIITILSVVIWFRLDFAYRSLSGLLTDYFTISDDYRDQYISYLKVKYAYYSSAYRKVLYSKTEEQLHENMKLIAKFPLDKDNESA